MDAVSLFCNEYMNIVYVNVRHIVILNKGYVFPAGTWRDFSFVKPIKQKLRL